MKVNDIHGIDVLEFYQFLNQVKQWIGIRGICLLKRYYKTASESDQHLILSKTSILLCRYSKVMTARLLMLDIKHQVIVEPLTFSLTLAEQHYIERQLLRFIRSK